MVGEYHYNFEFGSIDPSWYDFDYEMADDFDYEGDSEVRTVQVDSPIRFDPGLKSTWLSTS